MKRTLSLLLAVSLLLGLAACGNVVPGLKPVASGASNTEAAPLQTQMDTVVPTSAAPVPAEDPDRFYTVKITDVEEGKIIKIREYVYDEQWRKIQTLLDGVVVEKYCYDENGNLLSQWTTPPSQYVEYTYDDNGHALSKTSYLNYEPDDKWTRHSFELDSQGRNISDRLTSWDGTDRLLTTWEYEADGTCIRKTYDKDGALSFTERLNDHGDIVYSCVPGLEQNAEEFVYEYSEKGFWTKKSSFRGGVLSMVEEYELDEYGAQGDHYFTYYDTAGNVTQHYLFSESKRDENGVLILIINRYSNYTSSPDRYSYYEKVNAKGERTGGYPG